MQKLFTIFLFWGILASNVLAQCPCDCPYPVLFIHGWTSNYSLWDATTNNAYFKNVWGARADVFHAAPNARTTTNIAGADGIYGNLDDDIQWVFANESNTLNAGCVYALNFDVAIDGNNNFSEIPAVGGSPGFFHSDNNESSILKQGALVGKAIQAILAANPTKKKVVLVGHSMGGLASREYLQRTINNNNTSQARWWVNPAQADGHKVAKLLTVGTPHRGSNTMGNISNLRPQQGNAPSATTHDPNQSTQKIEDFLPDLSSEGVRDLRYSYDNWNPFAQDYPGVYLYGGKESDIPTLPTSYWTNDVNCNGTVNTTTQIGINQNGKTAGFSYEWDGTRDNPLMPLPTNLRYTYYVSNSLNGGSLAGGDLVVDDQRQWLFTNGTGTGTTNAGTPAPSDGTANRLSDRIYLAYGPNHVSEMGDTENIVRGLDEGDYPFFAWDVNKNITYGGMAQIRATAVPEGPNTTDADWYKFTLSTSSPVTITLNKTPGLAGRMDLFTTTPSNYANLTTNSTTNVSFTASSTAPVSVTSNNLAAGTYYFRIRHNAVTSTSWRTPYRFIVSANAGSRSGDEISEGSTLLTFSAFPNPALDQAEINLQVSENTPVKVQLYSATRQVIKELYNGSPEAYEMLSLACPLSDVAAGLYFVQVKGIGYTQTLRLVKL